MNEKKRYFFLQVYSFLTQVRKHPHNCGAAPKSGHAVTAAVTAAEYAVAAAPARGRRTRSPPGSRVGRARFTRAVAGATA